MHTCLQLTDNEWGNTSSKSPYFYTHVYREKTLAAQKNNQSSSSRPPSATKPYPAGKQESRLSATYQRPHQHFTNDEQALAPPKLPVASCYVLPPPRPPSPRKQTNTQHTTTAKIDSKKRGKDEGQNQKAQMHKRATQHASAQQHQPLCRQGVEIPVGHHTLTHARTSSTGHGK